MKWRILNDPSEWNNALHFGSNLEKKWQTSKNEKFDKTETTNRELENTLKAMESKVNN